MVKLMHAGRVASLVEEDLPRRDRAKTLRSRSKEMRKRMDGSLTLSTGSLGHSYASAARTITAKPHLLCKMPHIRPNSSVDTESVSLFDDIVRDLRGDHRDRCERMVLRDKAFQK